MIAMISVMRLKNYGKITKIGLNGDKQIKFRVHLAMETTAVN